MAEPVWILPRVAVAAHTRLLNEHRGRAYGFDTVRLSMALAMPRNVMALFGARARMVDMAASYAWSINRLKPFDEGNAATACLLAMLFLRLNGVELPAPASEKYAVFEGLASGRLGPSALVHWMKTRHLANVAGTSRVVGVQVRKGRVANVTVIDRAPQAGGVGGHPTSGGPPATDERLTSEIVAAPRLTSPHAPPAAPHADPGAAPRGARDRTQRADTESRKTLNRSPRTNLTIRRVP